MKDRTPASGAEEFNRALARVQEAARKLLAEHVRRLAEDDGFQVLDPAVVGKTFLELSARLLSDPEALLREQAAFWQRYAVLWQRTAERMLFNKPAEPVIAPAPDDRRFKDRQWTENALSDFVKQCYLLAADSVSSAVSRARGPDPHAAKKAAFFTRQMLDAMSPSNFFATNPQVLRATAESGGMNLVRGLALLLEDLERNKGRLRPRTADLEAFRLGENLATTPGKVIFQNELMQLLQYAPGTDQVHRRPLLIVPPWINKYYILDLQPKNSFIRWAVGEGHTVFVVSWVNPDASLAGKRFDDYLLQGPLAAIGAIEQATGEREVNAVGYCIGGTLLASTLAHMSAKDDRRVASATLLTSLLDFSDVGEISVFIDEEQVGLMERHMQRHGYFDGSHMATAFNLLRENELIWHYVVNGYLLGREPMAFDLLYWGMDSTSMPAAMHSFYLRNMYLRNLLREPGALSLAGTPIDLRSIRVPAYFLSTSEDHIAPWRSTYAGTRLVSGPVRFVLAGAGHNAGVINPPELKKRYGYWTNTELPPQPEAWFSAAQRHEGSWWTDWAEWIGAYSGGTVPARHPGDGALEPIEDAPGSAVKVRIT